MEIVINLPETAYKAVKDVCRLAGWKDWEAIFRDVFWEALFGDAFREALFRDVFWAIDGGQTLPEGHGRLIDADAFKDRLTKQRWTFRNVKEYTEMMLRTNDAPTIIKADGGDEE